MAAWWDNVISIMLHEVSNNVNLPNKIDGHADQINGIVVIIKY